MTDPTLTQAAQKRLHDERVFEMMKAIVQGDYSCPDLPAICPHVAFSSAELYVDEFERRTQEGGE